jgi:hypothetical protein
MVTRRFAMWVLFLAVAAAPSWATPIVTIAETYDGPADQYTWGVSPYFEQIEASGGNPGAYLHLPRFDTAVPSILTIPGRAEQFLGNYRAKGVISLGIDINQFAVGLDIDMSGTADKRPVTLVLHSDMGTPDDPSDDCDAAVVGRFVSMPGTGWRSYDFIVPSQSPVLPPRWQLVGTCAYLAPNDAWNRMIRNVGEARFDLGEPGFFYFFQFWNLGYDNPRIRFGKLVNGTTGAVTVQPIE